MEKSLAQRIKEAATLEDAIWEVMNDPELSFIMEQQTTLGASGLDIEIEEMMYDWDAEPTLPISTG